MDFSEFPVVKYMLLFNFELHVNIAVGWRVAPPVGRAIEMFGDRTVQYGFYRQSKRC